MKIEVTLLFGLTFSAQRFCMESYFLLLAVILYVNNHFHLTFFNTFFSFFGQLSHEYWKIVYRDSMICVLRSFFSLFFPSLSFCLLIRFIDASCLAYRRRKSYWAQIGLRNIGYYCCWCLMVSANRLLFRTCFVFRCRMNYFFPIEAFAKNAKEFNGKTTTMCPSRAVKYYICSVYTYLYMQCVLIYFARSLFHGCTIVSTSLGSHAFLWERRRERKKTIT